MARKTRSRVYDYLPPQRFWLLPLISGIAWFLTLFVLLVFWLAQGKPRYPFQTDPYVAFISDIGAHERMKPVFIVGGTITALMYAGTIFAANHARHDPSIFGFQDSKAKLVWSFIALFGGFVASISCIMLTIFDTDRFHNAHTSLLLLTFLGIGISAIFTCVVYKDETFTTETEFPVLRRYCVLNVLAGMIDIALSVAFVACLSTHIIIVEGCLEWAIAFWGAGYIWSFIGIVSIPDKQVQRDEERQALLENEH